VIQILGSPTIHNTDLSGRTIFSYLYEEGDPAAFQSGQSITLIGTVSRETRTAVIIFRPSGVVSDVKYNESVVSDKPLIGSGSEGRPAPFQMRRDRSHQF